MSKMFDDYKISQSKNQELDGLLTANPDIAHQKNLIHKLSAIEPDKSFEEIIEENNLMEKSRIKKATRNAKGDVVVANKEKAISEMSNEEFMEYSDNQAKQNL